MSRTRNVAGWVCLIVSAVLIAMGVAWAYSDYAHAAYLQGQAIYLLVLGVWLWR